VVAYPLNSKTLVGKKLNHVIDLRSIAFSPLRLPFLRLSYAWFDRSQILINHVPIVEIFDSKPLIEFVWPVLPLYKEFGLHTIKISMCSRARLIISPSSSSSM